MADQRGVRDLLFHPEMDAPPRRALDSANHEAMAAEQRADRAPGDRVRPEQGLLVRDLRTHPPAARLRERWGPLPQQRDLDRTTPLPLRRRQGTGHPPRMVAA